MSFTAALVMIAQSASPNVADRQSVRTNPVAVTATARVRIMRPVEVRVDAQGVVSAVQGGDESAKAPIQQARDKAGTVWIEFS